MWTAVIASLAEADGRPVLAVHQPKFTDLLAFRLYDRSISLAQDPVFRHLPDITFPPATSKGTLARQLDRLFQSALERVGLRNAFERLITRIANGRAARGAGRYVHIDMTIHSYAAGYAGPPGRRKLVWKSGGHAITTMAEEFGTKPTPRPRLALTEEENATARILLGQLGVAGDYIVVEPETNLEFFGELRAWPFDRWQALCDALTAEGHTVVQVGLPNSRALTGTVDLRGKTDFRVAAATIAGAKLFLGTESGLMHTARAVDTDAVILWGGVTLPEFAGYPGVHDIICHYVECAPCGNQGWCDFEHRCMRQITVDEVLPRVRAKLA